jgi:hypothetical protein
MKCSLHNIRAKAKPRSGQRKREFFLEETVPNRKEIISDHIQFHHLKPEIFLLDNLVTSHFLTVTIATKFNLHK